MFFRWNPFCPFAPRIELLGEEHPDETLAINLSAGFDGIVRTWSKSHARATRKARHIGVSVRQAKDHQDWLNYYRIYSESIKRWGRRTTSRYGLRLFEFYANANSPNVRLWLADVGSQTVSGALIFYAQNHAVYWHGAGLSEYFSMRPVHLLMAEIIKDACKRGLTWFDFNPSGGHRGVERFKRGFSPEVLAAPVVHIGKRRSLIDVGRRTKNGRH